MKSPADIEIKLKSYLHHRDFEVENIDLKEISRLMRNNETIYDMYADKTEKKFNEKKSVNHWHYWTRWLLLGRIFIEEKLYCSRY